MNLFTYGSLMFAEIWTDVVGELHEHKPGTLSGYQRRAVKGVSYPCLIETDPTDVVEGIVYFGISQRELETLDDFESRQYRRSTVSCQLTDALENRVEVEVYIWRDEFEDLIGGDWDSEWFRREGIKRFRG